MASETPESIGNEVAETGEQLPVDPRAKVIQVLAEQGFSRNEIARRTGITTFTVSTIAKTLGIRFDRSKTKQALKARLADLKLAQMGIAEGLNEDLTFARIMLRTATNRRDLAFAAKTISDLARAASALTPEWTEDDDVEEAKDFMLDLYKALGDVRDGFEAQYGVPLDSPEATRLIRQQNGLENQNDES